jgi:very-short-patch-repair endonuclease
VVAGHRGSLGSNALGATEPMKWLLALLVVVAIALVLVAVVLRSKKSSSDGVWPFFAKKLLTAPEQVLYFRLLKALPDHIVLAQVQLSRMLGVKRGTKYQSWLNRISQMSADFVICGKDATVLAVIELDDASHHSDRRKAADAKKGRALSAAGIKLVRWEVRALPDDLSIRTALLRGPALNPDSSPTVLGRGPLGHD